MAGFQLHDLTNSIDHDLGDGKTVMGRSTDCDIRVLSSSVSRKHGMFEVEGEQLTYSDLGSSNGSYVNGQKVTAPVHLNNGDRVTIGDFEFSVSSAGAAAADASADDAATQLAGGDEGEIPAMWSESAGLEQASGTQFFSEADESDAAAEYREGKLDVPPLGTQPRLVGLTAAIRGRCFELDTAGEGDHTWKIGRDEQSVDLVLPEESVSSQHAQLVNDGARWKIVNWMSTNGTFVNGQKGLSTYLKHGDVIRMGSEELVFELPQNWVTDNGGAQPEKVKQQEKGFLGRLLARLFGGKN